MVDKPRVLALMSGGVDSAVAAALLVEKGYRVTAATMKIWGGPPTAASSLHHGCYGPEEEEDIEDARRVAEALGIPYRVIDLAREYQSEVLDYFSLEYSCGRTPNPCVRCNHRIKFGSLIEKARDIGLEFDIIASGHYARIEKDQINSRYVLKKAGDLSKDQSYFLSFLSQEQLKVLLFPLGELTKAEVRKIAAGLGLSVADKPDSQNFISGDYSSVIKSDPIPGPIADKQGRILGKHHGIQNYTIGQRKGLGIAAPEPFYVIAIDCARNAVIVGGKKDIYHREFIVSNLNWISVPGLEAPATSNVKIRSSHRESEAEILPEEGDKVRVIFKEVQLAITPGQAAVFYQFDVVAGAGVIEKGIESY